MELIKVILKAGSILGVCTLISLPAHASESPDMLAFKACAQSQLSEEKQKANPSADAVIQSCNTEYNNLLNSLPPGLQDTAALTIRQDIQAALSSSQ